MDVTKIVEVMQNAEAVLSEVAGLDKVAHNASRQVNEAFQGQVDKLVSVARDASALQSKLAQVRALIRAASNA